MTLLWFSGFDDAADEGDSNFAPGGGAYNTSLQRTGAGCLAMSTTASVVTISGSAGVVFGGAVRARSSFSNADMLQFREGTTVHVRISQNTSGQLIIKIGTTTVATSTFALTVDLYAYLEVKVVVADSGGSVTVKVDGTTVVSYSGDTRNGGTSGVVDNLVLSRSASSMLLDDAYLLNTAGAAPYNDFLGDIAVRTLVPVGNGSSSDFVGSDGNTTDNYLLVDETPPSMTDYVGTAATGKADFYAMTDIPTTDLPLATRVSIYGLKSDAGTPPILKPSTKGDGGTIRDEAAVTLNTAVLPFAGAVQTTDPDGDTLTAANVNAMQAGMRTS